MEKKKVKKIIDFGLRSSTWIRIVFFLSLYIWLQVMRTFLFFCYYRSVAYKLLLSRENIIFSYHNDPTIFINIIMIYFL